MESDVLFFGMSAIPPAFVGSATPYKAAIPQALDRPHRCDAFRSEHA